MTDNNAFTPSYFRWPAEMYSKDKALSHHLPDNLIPYFFDFIPICHSNTEPRHILKHLLIYKTI